MIKPSSAAPAKACSARSICRFLATVPQLGPDLRSSQSVHCRTDLAMPLESQRGGDTNVVLRSRVSGHRRKRCGQPLGEDGAQSYGDVWSCEIDGIGCGYGCESSFIREWWTARIRNSDRS